MQILSGSARPADSLKRLQPSEVQDFVRGVLLDEKRDYPVVALTTDPRRGRSLVDGERIAQELRGLAGVVALETGDATWALSELLPPRLDVYGGAARIWWPGLRADSDPYDHRLYFVHSEADAERVCAQITVAVRQSAGEEAKDQQRDDERGRAPDDYRPTEPPERATVTAVKPGRIEVRSESRSGLVVKADLPVGLIADCAVPGLELRVQPLRPQGDGTWAFSLEGMLPHAWEMLAAEVRAGDVLVGRVQNIDKNLVFVDVLPGVVGVCHISELDYHRVHDIGEYVRVGELLPFQIMEMDAADMRLQLSRKAALAERPRPSPSLVPGGKPFVWREEMPLFESLRRTVRRPGASGPRVLGRRPAAAPDDREQVKALTAELAAASEERSSLVRQVRELREQQQQLRKELRAQQDRYEALVRRTSGDIDALASERSFLLAIRLCHARMFEEHDRLAYPLRRMRVGAEFLRSVRALEGVSVDKVVEVCTQVASGIAPSVPAREVHQLRDGPRGAGGRTRASDGARAWRCSLQDNTASARRLHWWSVPTDDGGVVELARVGLHDDFSIPEQ